MNTKENISSFESRQRLIADVWAEVRDLPNGDKIDPAILLGCVGYIVINERWAAPAAHDSVKTSIAATKPSKGWNRTQRRVLETQTAQASRLIGRHGLKYFDRVGAFLLNAGYLGEKVRGVIDGKEVYYWTLSTEFQNRIDELPETKIVTPTEEPTTPTGRGLVRRYPSMAQSLEMQEFQWRANAVPLVVASDANDIISTAEVEAELNKDVGLKADVADGER